jgi:hypothetical protein
MKVALSPMAARLLFRQQPLRRLRVQGPLCHQRHPRPLQLCSRLRQLGLGESCAVGPWGGGRASPLTNDFDVFHSTLNTVSKDAPLTCQLHGGSRVRLGAAQLECIPVQLGAAGVQLFLQRLLRLSWDVDTGRAWSV